MVSGHVHMMRWHFDTEGDVPFEGLGRPLLSHECLAWAVCIPAAAVVVTAGQLQAALDASAACYQFNMQKHHAAAQGRQLLRDGQICRS